jgi:hypothetical protein
LAVNDVNGFSYGNLTARANDAQSPINFANRYSGHFDNDLPLGSPFRTSIANELANIGSTLSSDNIIARAEALSCKGCHQYSNNANLGGGVTFPSSMGFVHTSEFTEAGPDGTRFRISNALIGTFLPAREAIMESFLNAPSCVTCNPGFDVSSAPLRTGSEAAAVPTLGGRRTH